MRTHLRNLAVILSLFLAQQARASGCGGSWPGLTGKEVVVTEEVLRFDLGNSALNCRSNNYDGTTCSLVIDGERYFGHFQDTLPETMRGYFEALDGQDIKLQKINQEWYEYDDCIGEETKPRWWQGHLRVIPWPGEILDSAADFPRPPF